MLKRKLVFYRWTSLDNDRQFNPYATMTTLASEIDRQEEFEVLDSGEYKTAVLPVFYSDRSRPVRLQMLSLRGGTTLPVKWRSDSSLESINLLDGEYSADVTHIVIWPDGVAAQEYHGNAPRMGRLSYFLRKKLDQKILIDGLYNPNMFARLDEIRGQVRQVHLALTRPETWAQDSRPGAFSTLLPAFAGVKTPSLKVAFGMGRYGPRDRFLDPDIEETVFEIAERAQEQVDSMVIGGLSRRTGKTERIDLLNERLHEAVELPAEREVPSIPRSDDAFSAIENARRSLDEKGLIADAIRAQAVQER
ncbi:DUF6731 family protein [Amycolatopsis sp. SB7-3]|uniref:DUF6731 family protein n=1 Tax=Amycolatopsis sp. SB7-3 TaxID=3373438 RepID=UPI003742F5CD